MLKRQMYNISENFVVTCAKFNDIIIRVENSNRADLYYIIGKISFSTLKYLIWYWAEIHLYVS